MTLLLRIANASDQLASEDRLRQWTGSGGTIGRAPSNDWVLPDTNSEISRVHAKIYFDSGHYYLEDLSTNGVFIGAERKRLEEGPYQIRPNDLLHIGHYQIDVSIEAVSPTVSKIPADISFDQDALLASEPPPLRPLPPDSGALGAFDEQSSFTPAMPLMSQAAASFIPEDWAVINHSAPNIPSPKAVSSSSSKVLTQEAQQEAAYKAMEALLSHFDQQYIASCLSLKGGQDKVFERTFNEVFVPEYQRKLDSSS